VGIAAISLKAADLDTVGVTLLRQVDPALQGTGVPVAQVEAPLYFNPTPPFETDPAAVAQPTSLFTWISSFGSATTYPNIVGVDSSHADEVARRFYGTAYGIATNVSHVDSYEAEFFYTNIAAGPGAPFISDKIVNQSFVFSGLTTSEQSSVEQDFDDYAATRGVLFVSGAGNGGAVLAPASSYNGIGVGVYDGGSSVGPTADGRSKPDLTAPGGLTSFSTPYVSGSAAVLLQAANRGDGGANTNSAHDIRTLKALLLNGAAKLNGWTNGTTTPLDARYGAGIVNVFNSWKQLQGGQHPFIETTANSLGNPHPPGGNTNNEPALSGWDFNALTNGHTGMTYNTEQVNHYYFNLPGNINYTLTTTLAWDRHAGSNSLNDLNLFLYNANSNLVVCSTSMVDNVEHLFLKNLPPGRYDLQVQKNPGIRVSADETYALAFEFFCLNLKINLTNSDAVISWPIYPTGFRLEAATTLTPPVSWSTVSAPVVVDTNTSQNLVTVPLSETNQFFRLQRP
jgi:hypothetical protein